jgi:hypothetical protein
MKDVGKLYVDISAVLQPFGIFYGHLVYFEIIWYTLWSFWYIFPVLVFCTNKNLATQQPSPITMKLFSKKWLIFFFCLFLFEWHGIKFTHRKLRKSETGLKKDETR